MRGELLDLSSKISSFKEIGEALPGGFLVLCGRKGEVAYANEAVLDLYGCHSQEELATLTGLSLRGLVHPDDYDRVRASMRGQLDHDNEGIGSVEYRFCRKDGAIRWAEASCRRLEAADDEPLLTIFVQDVTLQHEQGDALRDSVMSALTNTYNTVWLINDVETQSCSLYHSDKDEIHRKAISDALSHATYTGTKTHYVNDMVAPQDQERMQEQLSLPYILKQFEDRDQFSLTFLRDLKEGPRYYRIDFGKVRMPEGKTGVTMGFKDVDDEIRKDQELKEALREAKMVEERNQRLVEEVQSAAKLADLMGSVASLLSNMPALSFSKDAESGVYLACNQPFAEYAHKASPNEVVGLTDFDIFDAETAAHFAQDDQMALSMDKPYIFFEDVPDAAGEMRNLQTTKMKFRDNTGRLCTLGMCVDVSEMTRIKAAEVKQHEMEERLLLQSELLEQQAHREQQDRMITALASDYRCVYHVDLDKNDGVCYRSDPTDSEQTPEGVHFPYLERFSWYANNSVEESYREGFLNFIEPENVRKGLETNAIITYRYLAQRGGREYYEMIRMAGVRHAEDRDDHIVHAVGLGLTVIDEEMRETLAKNQALAEALAAAEEANRAKTAFLSNMSHEIRTPMNAIIGLDSLALRDDAIPRETRDYLEKIGGSARHLLGLINDILDMSRIESGRLVLRKEDFSFSSMLEQINTMVMSQCNEKGLTYECRVIGGVSDYYIGDDMKLKQVLINILSNAIKFTDSPGSVTLVVERAAVFGDHSTLKFYVSDTGIGMDTAFIPKIFDTFTQEDSSRSSKYGSTGLGMAITKNIVELMNGTIEVESKKGVGSTFTVTVTLNNSDHQGSSESYINPTDLRVLVVDDEEIAAEHARIVLDEVGISADTCHSGPEALHMLEVQHTKHEPYNLVLLDWKMPEMDGIAVATEIRKRYDRETTVIILTSFNWDEIMDEALHVGVDSFLAKPLFASNVIDEFERIARRNNMSLFKERKQADLEGRRILIAEDILINAEIVKELLGLRGALIDHAENGRIALETFAGSELGYYDAILMDVRMPEMDGLEATAAIRKLDRLDAKRIPIIAMTANAFDEDVQMSLQVGMTAHLSKPVEPDHLYATLGELIWEAEQES